MNIKQLNILVSLALCVFCASGADAAGSSTNFVAQLRQSGAIGEKTQCEVIVLSDEVVLIVPSLADKSEEELSAAATKISECFDQDADFKNKRLRLLASHQKSNPEVMEVSSGAVAAKLSMVSGERFPAMEAGDDSGVAGIAGGDSVKPMTEPEFAKARNDIAFRLKQLEKKGVGVQPFQKELTQSQTLFESGAQGPGTAKLMRVGKSVSDQESHIKERELAVKAAAQPKTPANVHKLGVSSSHSTAPTAATGAPGGLPSGGDFTNFNGSANAYYDQVAKEILKRELGGLAPVDGPFRLERFRIAKKIQAMEAAGANTKGVRQAYQKIEQLAASQDTKIMPELRDNIRYLQQQLGLSELQNNP